VEHLRPGQLSLPKLLDGEQVSLEAPALAIDGSLPPARDHLLADAMMIAGFILRSCSVG
jgi:hypothetical protein